ncbi:hypothetical protein [Streptomyces sp. NPDC101206]|uniref:hypothetical protein n=1 Tax=Streptomyces sp. NPDC101206 TaxID=3366128 RepID=UPI0037FC98F5
MHTGWTPLGIGLGLPSTAARALRRLHSGRDAGYLARLAVATALLLVAVALQT